MNGAQDRSTWEPEPFPPRNGAKLSIATRLIGWRGKISSIVAIVGARAQPPAFTRGLLIVACLAQGQCLDLLQVDSSDQRRQCRDSARGGTLQRCNAAGSVLCEPVCWQRRALVFVRVSCAGSLVP